MKLGFLIYSYFPYGGQQRDFHRIVQVCVERGHQVVVYTLKWQGDLLDGATIKFVPNSSISRLGRYRHFTQWVHNDLKDDPCDVVIGFNKMPGLDVYFAADPCFADKAKNQRGLYYRFTSRYRHFKKYEEAVFASDNKTRVLILSSLQRKAFEKYYPDCGARMYQVPPGIDRDRMVTDAAPVIRKKFRKEFNLKDSDLLIIQIGSGFKIKGVSRSIRAIAALPDDIRRRVKYFLVGQDKPNRYRKLANQLGIEDRFTVLPGRDDIPRFLLGADLLLHPAYSESAGYVLLEATISGLPVLTTSTCGYAGHIEKAGSGLVCDEPFEQTQLNEKLVEILTSPEREQWINNGLEYGKQEELYSLAKVATDFIEQFGQEAQVS